MKLLLGLFLFQWAYAIERPDYVDEEGIYYYKTDMPEKKSSDPDLEEIEADGTYIYKERDTKATVSPVAKSKTGLQEIDGDDYYYGVEHSEESGSVATKIGFFEFQNLEDNGTSYDDIYTDGGLSIFLDFENTISHAAGKLSWGYGFGVIFSNASGRFADGEEAKEVYNFFAVPVNANLSYRFQYKYYQLFVPYISGGADLIPFAELRDDDKRNKFGYGFGLHVAAGMNFQLSKLARSSLIAVDEEYGINHFYLTTELRQILGFGEFDFTSTFFSLGFAVDY